MGSAKIKKTDPKKMYVWYTEDFDEVVLYKTREAALREASFYLEENGGPNYVALLAEVTPVEKVTIKCEVEKL